VALTTGAKNYLLVPETSWGWALTGVKQLGQGFDLVAQYQGQWRSASLARVQSPGADKVHMVEAGLLFNFGAAFNQHLPPRRSLLNQRHQYLPR